MAVASKYLTGTSYVPAEPAQTEVEGLSEREVAIRRARGEANIAPPGTGRSYLQILRENAFTFINTILFSIAAVLVGMGRAGDAVATAGLVMVNVVIGVAQEGRAKRKLDQIALLTRPKATVLRGGREIEVDPAEIVLGDMLVVGAGDQIVVDGEVVGAGRMDVDESLLTGESDLIPKQAGDTVYSGSFAVTGGGRYVARKVGAHSVAAQITAGARAYRRVKTPLQSDVDLVIRLLVFVVSLLGGLLALSFLVKSVPVVESVKAAAVVVGLVPQGLFLMIAVTYALGAVRLAGKGALVQQANAIESLSNVDVLCLDKTGTLTTNRLKFYAMYAVGTNEERLGSVLGDYVANTLTPNRTAEAIGAAYEGQARRTREEVPFSSDRKWSAIAFDDRNLRGVYVMGAPEMLLPALKQGADWGAEQARAWTGQGLRVVLMAYTPEVARLRGESGEAVLPADLEPLGLVSLSDELRPEAEATLRGFAEAGVRIKIISGDNPDTVAALARQAGLGDDIKLVSGLDLAVMSEAEFGRTAEEATVFGRISPQQKEALVRALKANGHYVAMIGDGVNDVLSLKQSQLGIAMQGGSQATRGVADMVLLNDSFAVLPAAIQEGQRIINGMHDAVRLLLARTMYVMFIIVGASVVGVSFPVTPKHNAILALLTVGIPTLALAAWARPGAAPHRRLIASVANFVVPAGLSVAGVSLVVYLGYLLTTGNVEMARTALTTTATLCGLALIVMLKPEGAGDDWRHAILALSMFVLYIIVLAVPGLCGAFELCAMSALDVAPVGLVVAGWGVALHFAFRKRLFERLVGYVAG